MHFFAWTNGPNDFFCLRCVCPARRMQTETIIGAQQLKASGRGRDREAKTCSIHWLCFRLVYEISKLMSKNSLLFHSSVFVIRGVSRQKLGIRNKNES